MRVQTVTGENRIRFCGVRADRKLEVGVTCALKNEPRNDFDALWSLEIIENH